jgi:hypothetical protein
MRQSTLWEKARDACAGELFPRSRGNGGLQEAMPQELNPEEGAVGQGQLGFGSPECPREGGWIGGLERGEPCVADLSEWNVLEEFQLTVWLLHPKFVCAAEYMFFSVIVSFELLFPRVDQVSGKESDLLIIMMYARGYARLHAHAAITVALIPVIPIPSLKSAVQLTVPSIQRRCLCS